MGFQIDPSFIRDAEDRPKITISDAGGIPLIDLSPLLHHHIPSDPSDPAIPSEISSLIAAIGAACRDWGFFQVVNHGVDPQLLERIEAVAVEFFALPAEEKRKVQRDEVNALGYYDSEHTKNVRDWKEVLDLVVREYDDGLLVLKNRWPEYPPSMRVLFQRASASTSSQELHRRSFIAGASSPELQRRPEDLHRRPSEHTSFSHSPPTRSISLRERILKTSAAVSAVGATGIAERGYFPLSFLESGAEVAVLYLTKSGEVVNYQAFTNAKGVYTVAETMPEKFHRQSL